MDIRLIAFDLDGTLLGEGGCVLESNSRALRAAEEKGIRLVLNSGRNFEKVREFGEGLRNFARDLFAERRAGGSQSGGADGLSVVFIGKICARELCRVIERRRAIFQCGYSGPHLFGQYRGGTLAAGVFLPIGERRSEGF